MVANCADASMFNSNPKGMPNWNSEAKNKAIIDYPEDIPEADAEMPYEAYLDDEELAAFRNLQKQHMVHGTPHESLVEIHRAQMKVKSDLQKRRKKLQDLQRAEQNKIDKEIEEIMQGVRIQLGKATPRQLYNPQLIEEVGDNIRLLTQKENPALYNKMVAGRSRSRNQKFSNAFCGFPREPPKLIQGDKQDYFVEYPPEEASAAEGNYSMQCHEEFELAATLNNGLNLQRKRELEYKFAMVTTTTKRAKFNTAEGNFYHSGYDNADDNEANNYFEAEEAGQPMPPTSK